MLYEVIKCSVQSFSPYNLKKQDSERKQYLYKNTLLDGRLVTWQPIKGSSAFRMKMGGYEVRTLYVWTEPWVSILTPFSVL
jgi:hypothetical protein